MDNNTNSDSLDIQQIKDLESRLVKHHTETIKALHQLLTVLVVINLVLLFTLYDNVKVNKLRYGEYSIKPYDSELVSYERIFNVMQAIGSIASNNLIFVKDIPNNLVEGSNMDIFESNLEASGLGENLIIVPNFQTVNHVPVRNDKTKLALGKIGKSSIKCTDFISCIIQSEGMVLSGNRHILYLDTSNRCKHVRASGRCATIGYGFNVDANVTRNADGTLTSTRLNMPYTYNPNDIRSAPTISEEQARINLASIINQSIKEVNDVLSKLGHDSCWDGLGSNSPRQFVLMDMVYNMGAGTFSDFKSTIGHICSGNFNQAADNISVTPYCADVKSRCTRNQKMLKQNQWFDKH
jgi:GH24 family phage-related lysozyme (muramidase)